MSATASAPATPSRPSTTAAACSSALPFPSSFWGASARAIPVLVAAWAARDQAIPGEIVDLGSRIDPVSRSFTARARVANAGDAFRPGMSFAVTLDVHGGHYPLVPEISVRYGTDGAFVWVVREGAAARVPVRIVQRQEATVLVDAALEDGEPVVVEGIQRLRPGLAVSVATPRADFVTVPDFP